MSTGNYVLIGILIVVLSQSSHTVSLTHDLDFFKLISCDLTPDVTVAADGSGDFFTITACLAAVSKKKGRVVIHIKAGLYAENVIVTMYGDGKEKTIVTGNLSRIDNPDFTTYQTATFSVIGDQFLVRDMGFLNVAGPEKYQAVAFHSSSTHSVMYRCAFKAFQDTLYGVQFYRECEIIGTVDFIFGKAAAVFQMCEIRPRTPLPGQVVTITAQGADDHSARSGFAILGRPWGSHARVAFLKTELPQFIHPKGWLAWNRSTDPPPPTIKFGEFMNYGPGSVILNRVHWHGYVAAMSEKEAETFSVDALINEEGWLKDSCVPYNGSL